MFRAPRPLSIGGVCPRLRDGAVVKIFAVWHVLVVISFHVGPCQIGSRSLEPALRLVKRLVTGCRYVPELASVNDQ